VLTLCGLLYAVREGWGSWSPHRVFAAALPVLGLPLLASAFWGPVRPWGVLVALRARRSAAGCVACLLLLGLSNGAQSSADVFERLRFRNRESFLFLLDAERFAAGLDPTLQDVKYWYDEREVLPTPRGDVPTRYFFDSFIATRMWLGNLLGGSPVPRIRELGPGHLGASGRVAVLALPANKEEYCRRLTAHFAALGLPLRREAERDFRYEHLAFSMVVYRIQK
jgi:hypothetical protein